MKGLMPEAVDYHIMRYDIRQLPQTTEGLNTWVEERFREKEERLRRYYTSGKAMNDRSNETRAPLRSFSVHFPASQGTRFWDKDRLRLLVGILSHLATLGLIVYSFASFGWARWMTAAGLAFFLGMNQFGGGWDQAVLYRLE